MTNKSDLFDFDIENKSDRQIVDALYESQLAAATSIKPCLDAITGGAEKAVARLNLGGRIIYVGAGTSGRIAAQDGAELIPTFDWPANKVKIIMAGGNTALQQPVENAEDDIAVAKQIIKQEKINSQDTLIAISASGTTPFVVTCASEAKSLGALVIGIFNQNNTSQSNIDESTHLTTVSDFKIFAETGREFPNGSTRMKAGTAQKIATNLLSTLIMTKLGKTYKNLMVEVKPRNKKLRQRCISIIAELTDLPLEVAEKYFMEADESIKVAVLMAKFNMTKHDAITKLSACGGRLDKTIDLATNKAVAAK